MDLISRQAAIDALLAEGRNVDSRYLESERIIHESDAVEVISLLPSIDPVKHGKWLKYPGDIVSDDGLWGETLYDCSECGHTRHVATEYCSKCGAKMVQGGEIQVRWKNARVCPFLSDDEVLEYCVEGPCSEENCEYASELRNENGRMRSST